MGEDRGQGGELSLKRFVFRLVSEGPKFKKSLSDTEYTIKGLTNRTECFKSTGSKANEES